MDDTSSTEGTAQIVRQFHDAFNRHDVPAIMALMSVECVFENTYPPPDGVRLVGQENVRGFWVELFSQSPQAHFEIEELIACGDRAALRWRYTWGPPSGESRHVRGVDIYRVRAGLVCEKLSYVKG